LIVARYADGWNVPFMAPEVFAQRNATLDRWCERERRDPAAIVRTANLGLALGADAAEARRQEENLRLMFGPMTDFVRPGILVGTPAAVIDRMGSTARGRRGVILALAGAVRLGGPELSSGT
jgi:alkanesulfonate monooxygenase SsuD/methylene tetrahydromethanopterin reductase-like flavin-dependent oxidoreductase (luciferase family)